MVFYLQRAIRDFKDNKFLHAITVFTTALSILLVSSFGLFYLNVNDIINSWTKGVRIFVYLEKNLADKNIESLQNKISNIYGVKETVFISKESALESLKTSMKTQDSLFENLSENPLPDSFEILLAPSFQTWEKIETIASDLSELPLVTDVEYGQKWLEKFLKILHFFKYAGMTMGAIFLIVTVFIIANTIRLALYSRREEIEIMRLVGASDSFIKIPFYIEGIFQGALGGIIGLGTLYIPFQLITSNLEKNFSISLLTINFFSLSSFSWILFGSIFVGWLGCFVSLKQYLKTF